MQQVRIHDDVMKRIKKQPDFTPQVRVIWFVNLLLAEALNLRDNQQKQRRVFGIK